MTEQQKEMAIYERAVDLFGEEVQVNKAIEELAELTQALSKWLTYNNTGIGNIKAIEENIALERADVAIMLNQLDVIFGDNADVEYERIKHLDAFVSECKENAIFNGSLILEETV